MTGATPGRTDWIVFRVSGQAFALAVAEVDRVVPMAELAALPGAPAFVAGILSLGGEGVPTLRTDRLLRLDERAPDLSTPILVVRHAGRRLGLIVDGVDGVARVSAEQARPIPPGHSFADCATALVRLGTEPVVLLSAVRLLLEEERRRIDELCAQHEERLRALAAGAS